MLKNNFVSHCKYLSVENYTVQCSGQHEKVKKIEPKKGAKWAKIAKNQITYIENPLIFVVALVSAVANLWYPRE